MKIKKTALTSLIKEELTAFYVTPDAFAKQKKLETKPIQEMKYLVKIADIGTIVMDAAGEGEVRTRLIKKLRGGKKDIESITRIAKGKADQAAQKLGLGPEDETGEPTIDEAKLNEAHPKQVTKMFQKKSREVVKLLNIIEQSLGFLDKRHNGDPGNTENLMILTGLHRALADAEQTINKFPKN